MKQFFSSTQRILTSLVLGISMFGMLTDGNAQYGSFASNNVPNQFVSGPNVIIVCPVLGAGTTCKARKFKAFVKSCFNIPVVGATVHFSVSGANSGTSADIVTDAWGKAVFSYAGPNSGLDLITASSSGSLNGYAVFLWKKCTTPVCTPPTNQLYVDATAPAGGNGGTWECAMNDLNTAITTANGNAAIKSIWVAEGTYKPSVPAGRAATFNITRADLQILGGFTGVESNATDADPVANPTIISGDIGVPGNTSDNALHAITVDHVAAAANPLEINGFTVQGGNANVTGAGNNAGGALFANYIGATVVLNRVVFTQNNASGYGGAVWISHSDNIFFNQNTFTSNTSDLGGAVYGFFSSAKFLRTVFSQNTAATSGGAYYGNYGTPVFTFTVFSANTAKTGGAVYQNQANGNYFNSLLSDNSATFQGGAIYEHNASATQMVNTTFFNNSSTSYGGAILLGLNASTTVASNVIFWKNRKGGAANIAAADVYNFGGSTTNGFHNCALQANTSIPADDGTNIIANSRGVDPLFTNDASPIGADLTWGTADDGLQLQDASPSVNSGDNTPTSLAGLIVALIGNARVVCTTVDKGAYEDQNCASISAARSKAPVNNFVRTVPESLTTGIVANPFSSDLQIRYTGTEKCAVTVYAASGKRMYASGSIAQGTTHVNAGAWGRGFYQVVLNTASGKQMTFKVIKM